ncbi:MAG: alpha-L-fucosidase [Candidatus Methylacidiphilales bacterium]
MIQPWFQQAKLGIFLHWGIYAVKPTGESWPFFLGDISYEDYMAQCHGFTAEHYDPVAWATLFAKAGARYAVLTAKHHDGMALWDSAASDLNVAKATPAGRDLIGPYCQALRANGLKVGLYFSHLDWSHPDYATLPKAAPPSEHSDATRANPFNFREHNPEAWERFLAFHRAQLRELCERYQPDLLWFDGDWDRTAEQWRMTELREQLHQWAPGVILNARMKGFGDYDTPEQGLPTVTPKGPWEFCMTCNDHWGYFGSDKNYKSVRQILWYFAQCISKGGNLLLDFGPKADGTFPEEQLAIFEGLARWNTKHADAIFPTGPGLPLGHFDGPTTLSADQRTLYLFCFYRPEDSFPVTGIRNGIESVRVLGSGSPLGFKKLGGAAWSNIPGVLWIDAPDPSDLDPDGTVIEVKLDAPLDLFRGEGGAIEHNTP